MKLISLFCIVFLSAAACSHFSGKSHRIPASSSPFADERYLAIQPLVSEAMTFRAEALQFAQKIKLDQGGAVNMTRAENEWVRAKGLSYLRLREKLRAISLDQAKTFSPKAKVVLAPGKGTKTDWQPDPNNFPERIETYSIDPTDRAGQEAIFRVQMSLATSLILMDNYLVAILPYQENRNFRYLLNYDTTQSRVLQSITDEYNSAGNRQMLSKAVAFIEDVMAWRRKNGADTSLEESYLYGLSQSSLWYLNIRNDKYGTQAMKDSLENLWGRIGLRSKRGVRAVSFGVSMGFGNMVGLASSRTGYMLDLPAGEKQQIASELKPLDILLEKTPFRLTDKMIPGHYGHVAIWIGTEPQLRELGVWEELKEPLKEKIRSGHHIIEALRPGVQINTLEHFLNIDDMLVLRDTRPMSDDYRRTALRKAFAQIGKEYDFNFDVNTDIRIVCSEIAYVVFDDINWPKDITVGRYTISPDGVAVMAVGDNTTLEPTLLYYGGKRYTKNLRESLALLLKSTDESYAAFEKLQRN